MFIEYVFICKFIFFCLLIIFILFFHRFIVLFIYSFFSFYIFFIFKIFNFIKEIYYIQFLSYFLRDDFKNLRLPAIELWLKYWLKETRYDDYQQIDNINKDITISNYNTLINLHNLLMGIFNTNDILEFCDMLLAELSKLYNLDKNSLMDVNLLDILENKYKKKIYKAKLPLSLKEFKNNNYKLNWDEINLGDNYFIIFIWFLTIDLNGIFINKKVENVKDFYWFIIFYSIKLFILLIINKNHYRNGYYITMQYMLFVLLVFIKMLLRDCKSNLKEKKK